MRPTDSLQAVEAIKQVKARYCRYIDTKDWLALRALLTDDASFECPTLGGKIDDIDVFVNTARTFFDGAVSMHHCHNPEIRVLSPDEAAGVWAMEDRIDWSRSGSKPQRGFGYYEETYRLHKGQWQIASIVLTYRHLEQGDPGQHDAYSCAKPEDDPVAMNQAQSVST